MIESTQLTELRIYGVDNPSHNNADKVFVHGKFVYVFQNEQPGTSDLAAKLDQIILMLTAMMNQGNDPALKDLASRLNKKQEQLQQAMDAAPTPPATPT